MNASEIVENLTQQGVQLWADNGKLKINSPKGILTPELRTEIAQRKPEILKFLSQNNQTISDNCATQTEDLSLQTIGRLIGGFCNGSSIGFKAPVIDSKAMAKKLVITFRPLPQGYKNDAIIKFREKLELKFQSYGIKIEPWEQATKEFSYELKLPFTNWKKSIKTRVIKSGISAVVDVERHPNFTGKLKIFTAEKLYQGYSRFILKNQKMSVSKIAQFISWAEENIRPAEDPTNTQVIVLTEPDEKFSDPKIPYEQKIPIGISTLVRTFSEIVIGVSHTQISILNMNLSDSKFPIDNIDEFVLKSLVPKIYVPIMPLSMSRFEVGEYDSKQSEYAAKLVKLGQELASTGLLPAGFKIDNVIKRKSHRDIVDWMAKGRTGVSYGFVAYAEPPQYVGPVEISAKEWESLASVDGFSNNELRQNESGRKYIRTKIGQEWKFKQIPDIWLVCSRSGSNKTNLNLETDVLRIGLKGNLLLQLPQGNDLAAADIKPSYDIYVMIAMTLAAALYAPALLENGAPMVHFHGYPSKEWFQKNEYCTGVENPSVPCGTYEAGVFNFLGIRQLAEQSNSKFALGSLIEPDHGTNFIAPDLTYIVDRLKAGIEQGQIELGGKYLVSLKENLALN
ncbi:MAG: hypothetical protein RMX96_26070 [Nostoc sp. ChiSLP02]|nr:hypothetical protein [Nostoc sp. DedSLP05]MDZ8101177.1 hypothetical protein [Nostoc sp. DedSLP01]MDZ8188309.1 hypothetical protein [Nostoc sp. ChiSLP02]